MFKVYVRHEDYAEILNIYVIDERPDGKKVLVSNLNPVEFDLEWNPGMPINKPTITIQGSLGRDFLQGMVNGAADLGIIPEGKPVLENEMTAVRYHLEDMRKLVSMRGIKNFD